MITINNVKGDAIYEVSQMVHVMGYNYGEVAKAILWELI